MQTMITNLPVDLLEEILSRVPVKSIRAVRSTCKNWKTLSKNQSFANKHIEKAARENEVTVITGNNKDHLISVKFFDFRNKNFDLSTNSKGKLVTRENSDLAVVHRVFYCNGLLLCLCGISNVGFWYGTRIGVQEDGSKPKRNVVMKCLLLDTTKHVVATKSLG